MLLAASLAAAAAANAATFEGQVVCCEDCWTEADRKRVEYGTADDVAKAAACIAGGDPTALAVEEDGKFVLYHLELGEYRLPGKDWLELVGDRVRVTGTAAGNGKIRVDEVEVVRPSLAARDRSAAVGRMAELNLSDLSGAQQSLGAFAGRIVVLNFWATYCAPCRVEMPDLTAIQNQNAALGVQVIGAAADTADDRAKVLDFVREMKINFPVWLAVSSQDMRRFGLTGALPGTVIIGRDGKIARVFSGVVKQADLQAQIDAMLAAADAGASGQEDARREDAHAKSAEVSSVPS